MEYVGTPPIEDLEYKVSIFLLFDWLVSPLEGSFPNSVAGKFPDYKVKNKYFFHFPIYKDKHTSLNYGISKIRRRKSKG